MATPRDHRAAPKEKRREDTNSCRQIFWTPCTVAFKLELRNRPLSPRKGIGRTRSQQFVLDSERRGREDGRTKKRYLKEHGTRSQGENK